MCYGLCGRAWPSPVTGKCGSSLRESLPLQLQQAIDKLPSGKGPIWLEDLWRWRTEESYLVCRHIHRGVCECRRWIWNACTLLMRVVRNVEFLWSISTYPMVYQHQAHVHMYAWYTCEYPKAPLKEDIHVEDCCALKLAIVHKEIARLARVQVPCRVCSLCLSAGTVAACFCTLQDVCAKCVCLFWFLPPSLPSSYSHFPSPSFFSARVCVAPNDARFHCGGICSN